MLLKTPPFQVVKSDAVFLLKFWLKSKWSIVSPKSRFPKISSSSW
jgi:hypothetical protein